MGSEMCIRDRHRPSPTANDHRPTSREDHRVDRLRAPAAAPGCPRNTPAGNTPHPGRAGNPDRTPGRSIRLTRPLPSAGIRGPAGVDLAANGGALTGNGGGGTTGPPGGAPVIAGSGPRRPRRHPREGQPVGHGDLICGDGDDQNGGEQHARPADPDRTRERTADLTPGSATIAKGATSRHQRSRPTNNTTGTPRNRGHADHPDVSKSFTSGRSSSCKVIPHGPDGG